MSWVVLSLPAAADPFNQGYQSHLQAVFGNTPSIMLASVLAFWCGSFANSYVLAKMKLLTRGCFLWRRTIGSTLVTYRVVAFLKRKEHEDSFDVHTNFSPFKPN